MKVREILLEKGASIDRFSSDAAKFGFASKYQSPEVMQGLLDRGYEIDAADSAGYTALQRASQAGDAPFVKFLLEKGASIVKAHNFDTLSYLAHMIHHIGWTAVDFAADAGHARSFRPTPLEFAARYGHTETVKALMTRGAASGIYAWAGKDALRSAAKGGHVDTLDLLIEHGVLIDVSSIILEPDLKPEIIRIFDATFAKRARAGALQASSARHA